MLQHELCIFMKEMLFNNKNITVIMYIYYVLLLCVVLYCTRLNKKSI